MANERRNRIREYIDTHREVTLEELTALCGCSSMTIWRDLNQLEQEGYIKRTLKGAISLRMIQPDMEGGYGLRASQNILGKQRIAQAAVERLGDGGSIFLDAGSTVMEVAKLLPNHHYSIITSGANIAIELSQKVSCNVVCLGGQIGANTLSFSGPISESALAGMNIDTALMAASGYEAGAGFFNGSPSEQHLKHMVIEKASRVIMLMDLTKIGKRLTFTFAQMKDVDTLICDGTPPAPVLEEAERCGAEVVAAGEPVKDD